MRGGTIVRTSLSSCSMRLITRWSTKVGSIRLDLWYTQAWYVLDTKRSVLTPIDDSCALWFWRECVVAGAPQSSPSIQELQQHSPRSLVSCVGKVVHPGKNEGWPGLGEEGKDLFGDLGDVEFEQGICVFVLGLTVALRLIFGLQTFWGDPPQVQRQRCVPTSFVGNGHGSNKEKRREIQFRRVGKEMLSLQTDSFFFYFSNHSWSLPFFLFFGMKPLSSVLVSIFRVMKYSSFSM